MADQTGTFRPAHGQVGGLPRNAEPLIADGSTAAHDITGMRQLMANIQDLLIRAYAAQGRTFKLASVSLKEAYPFPGPHFSADVVTSTGDAQRPASAQKIADLTYHEATGVLAVRGVRRTGEPWICLIPASNIKGMCVLSEGEK